jgi:hypothetical protein
MVRDLMPDEPTLGEVMRRLDDVFARLDRMLTQMQQDRDRGDQRYVPRVEWIEARKGIDDRFRDVIGDVSDLKVDRASDTNARRQVVLSIGLAAFAALVSIATTGLLLLGK